ncbi:hypothetical protein PILCRDRAFT_821628 [Piloderma croceum F 1598]|uniref:Uncharacterized protein n=1 Tax=Piloderma croceum (strain F 1598) TaxID=765440 RepID=A0A0C3BV41_PILCF|nr:hypothetical protein PILCRDRAFT_821628 [Piloderma croceum F 1598]
MSVKRSERDLEDKLKALQQEFDNVKLSHENEIMALKVKFHYYRYPWLIIVLRGLNGA